MGRSAVGQRRMGCDKDCEETRARGTASVTVGVQGIMALPEATHELSVPAGP